eukprot:5917976-Prymnesium_polylepis.2
MPIWKRGHREGKQAIRDSVEAKYAAPHRQRQTAGAVEDICGELRACDVRAASVKSQPKARGGPCSKRGIHQQKRSKDSDGVQSGRHRISSQRGRLRRSAPGTRSARCLQRLFFCGARRLDLWVIGNWRVDKSSTSKGKVLHLTREQHDALFVADT